MNKRIFLFGIAILVIWATLVGPLPATARYPQATVTDLPAAIESRLPAPLDADAGGDRADGPPEGVLSSLTRLTERVLSLFGWNLETLRRYGQWLVGIPALLVFLIIVWLARPRRKTKLRRPKPKADPVPIPAQATPKVTESGPVDSDLSIKDQVLLFFFNIFKIQAGAAADAPTQLFLAETRPSCPSDIYEMRLKDGDAWNNRRMSIGLLGDGSGSRSECYYVIFDAHIVVKIPARPLPDFYAYNRQIAREDRIAARLAPRDCIVPRVSVILKQIHTLADEAALSEDQLEKKYVHLVETRPKYQQYLKIGATFAFFMDLSRHFFLARVLDDLHEFDRQVVEEAMSRSDLIWDPVGFAGRYGDEAATVCTTLQDAYRRCEPQLLELADQLADGADTGGYRLRRWFAAWMAGETVQQVNGGLPESFCHAVDDMLAECTRPVQSQVDTYRDTLVRYIRETRFSQTRTWLANLAAGLLDLLAWLEEKAVAMRDLKPENLFVAGNPDSYPVFMNHLDQFSIGLIDVETAVVVPAGGAEKVEQPQLAGTPLYATPSHLLANPLIEEAFDDLPACLHLQDWYATLGIIYRIITGRNLFDHTAGVFPTLIEQVKMMDPAGPDLLTDIIQISRQFWASAVAEFHSAMDQQRDSLSRVPVQIPDRFVPYLKQALAEEKDQIAQAVNQAVDGQTLFSGAEKKQRLKTASIDTIRYMRQRLAQDPRRASRSPRAHTQAAELLDVLEELKHRAVRKTEALAQLDHSPAQIGIDHVLEAMFQRVFRFMYPRRWPRLAPALWHEPITDSATMTYTATL